MLISVSEMRSKGLAAGMQQGGGRSRRRATHLLTFFFIIGAIYLLAGTVRALPADNGF